ncbi:hypothetical protein EMIT0324P_30387 [Pseudomonas chlororaphis]
MNPMRVSGRLRRASDRHSNDRPEADISSMRQQITEALRNQVEHIDSSSSLCKSKRR